jgi:hypothetical protein
MENIKLTNEELNELIGGQSAKVLELADILNSNTTFECRCYYNNSSAIENSNSSSGCGCICQ